MNLFTFAKAELLRSNTDKKHPFRYCVLATIGDYPELRTVVKRSCTPNLQLTIFSDSRTPKVTQIKKNPKISLLFYHPKKQLQLRLYGTARLLQHDDLNYARCMQDVRASVKSMQDYTTFHPPGVPIPDEGSLIYGDTINLAVLDIQTTQVDIVLLGTEKHTRNKYILINGIWEETKLVP